MVQETLLRAWRTPAVLEQTRASVRPWLFTVAKHIVIDEWRSTRRRSEVLTDECPRQTVTDTAQQTMDRQLVLAALRTQSPDHRRVLLECYFRGASVAEAVETGLQALGYSDVRKYGERIQEWVESGYPTESTTRV